MKMLFAALMLAAAPVAALAQSPDIAGAKAAGLQTLLYRGQPTLAAELAELGVVLSN